MRCSKFVVGRSVSVVCRVFVMCVTCSLLRDSPSCASFVRCLLFVVYCLLYACYCLVFVVCLLFGCWCLVFGVWCLSFGV